MTHPYQHRKMGIKIILTITMNHEILHIAKSIVNVSHVVVKRLESSDLKRVC